MAIHLEDRTEPATPRRRKEARAKGQVVRSADLTATFMLVGGLLGLRFLGPGVFESFLHIVAAGLGGNGAPHLQDSAQFAAVAGMEMLAAAGPLIALIMVLGIAALLIQVGPLLTLQPVTPSLEKISPLRGLRRLFSARSLVTAGLNLGKLLLVAAIVYAWMNINGSAVLFSAAFELHQLVSLAGTLVFEVCMQIAVVLLVLALADYGWQHMRHERELMMTREEVRDELRSMEGDPVIRRRRRQLQMQIAVQRLRKTVPTADVVVTNPTHLAVAIRYDSETMIAPKVVAKGADYAALRIRQIAARHSIPIIERRPLARALYDSVEVGQYVPERFYQAIAEILAYIYELSGRSPAAGRAALTGAR